jgi:hypothetical protein
MSKLRFSKKAQGTLVSQVPDWVMMVAFLLLAIFIVIVIQRLMVASV